jgi:hypothetical protein
MVSRWFLCASAQQPGTHTGTQLLWVSAGGVGASFGFTASHAVAFATHYRGHSPTGSQPRRLPIRGSPFYQILTPKQK